MSSQHAEPAEVRLSATSYLVLGLIHRHGPRTSYGLKRLAAETIGGLWPQSHAQLYVEPARLVRHGLLRVVVERTGRRRHHYDITPAGRVRLHDWLRTDDGEGIELRDPALIKLLILEGSEHDADRQRMDLLASTRAVEHRRRWAALALGVDESHTGGTDAVRRLAASIEHTAAEFWSTLGAAPGCPAQPGSPGCAPRMPSEEQINQAFTTFWILANPVRITLLCALLQADSSVAELAEHLDGTPGEVRQHLAKLTDSGLVRVEVEDGRVRLCLDDQGGPRLATLLAEALRSPRST